MPWRSGCSCRLTNSFNGLYSSSASREHRAGCGSCDLNRADRLLSSSSVAAAFCWMQDLFVAPQGNCADGTKSRMQSAVSLNGAPPPSHHATSLGSSGATTMVLNTLPTNGPSTNAPGQGMAPGGPLGAATTAGNLSPGEMLPYSNGEKVLLPPSAAARSHSCLALA